MVTALDFLKSGGGKFYIFANPKSPSFILLP